MIFLKKYKSVPLLFLFIIITPLFSSSQKSSLAYTVSMDDPEWHVFQVKLNCKGIKKEFLDFKMPVWTPGYYQRLDFAKNVESFGAADAAGNPLKWEKLSANTWRVHSRSVSEINLSYHVKTSRSFVAQPYLDETRGYILPAGVFFHIDKMIQHPVTVTVKPQQNWKQVATGLDAVPGKRFSYSAPDFDILYDSPLLAGNLEELPSFKVKGITHRFMGYKLGDFDKTKLMADLKKIVEASVNIIGHIPYRHYTFIAIGPGAGGIEHLNSTTFSFNSSGFSKRENYIRTLYFLAHEYFHHYNVKRIRPVDLGPFDYDNGNHTKMLWISEGLSVYYEYLVVRRAGITTDEELLNAFRNNITAFESKPGRLFQSLEQASWETWSDGPFGRTNEEINKTISYYDKGPAVGLLLDFKIRQTSENKKSLDDVMRMLYKEFYRKRKRGFTQEEFRTVCEMTAGAPLDDVFEYVSTTRELNYPEYLSYAGLTIDTAAKEQPGAYLGFTVNERRDSVVIASVDWQSPAWNARIRIRQTLLEINDKKASEQLLKETMAGSKEGEIIRLRVLIKNSEEEVQVRFGKKVEKSFHISPVSDPTPLQKRILGSWLNG
jgi:predicted metalloprotease with PDZ domain